MSTDWLGAAVVVGFVVVVVLGVACLTWWQARKFRSFGRRPSDPQRGAANGTGVEHGPRRLAVADLPVLPRSPLAPVGVGDPRLPAPTGLHPRRVTVHG